MRWFCELFSYQIPIPKNPLSGSRKKNPNPYLDLQAEHLPDPAAALLLFIQVPAGSQHHCYARSTNRTRSEARAQNKNMHQPSWCAEAACNKFHACAKESYYIARRVPKDLTKYERGMVGCGIHWHLKYSHSFLLRL